MRQQACSAAFLLAVLVAAADAMAQVPPILTIRDASVVEGNAGTTTTLSFRYELNQPTSTLVTGGIEVIGLTGAAFNPAIGGGKCGDPGIDYKVLGGLLLYMSPNPTVAPSGAVSLTVCGDSYAEPNEHVFIRFVGVQGAQCFEGTCDGIGTIVNDGDKTAMPASTLSVSDPVVSEPITGTSNVTFTVSLGSASLNDISVAYRTVDGSARSTGSGSGPWTCPMIDYFSKSGTLPFPSGVVRKTVTTAVCGGDSTSESNETFRLTLSNASGTTIADAAGTATIRNFAPKLRL
jgi:hypothetical protein